MQQDKKVLLAQQVHKEQLVIQEVQDQQVLKVLKVKMGLQDQQVHKVLQAKKVKKVK